MVRVRVIFSVSVSFSVCKPTLEWKVGCREWIPMAAVSVTGTGYATNKSHRSYWKNVTAKLTNA